MLRDFLLHAEQYLTCSSNKSSGEVWLVISNMAELLGLCSRGELLEMMDAGNLEIMDVQCTTPTHPKASRPLKDKKKKKQAKNHVEFEGIAAARKAKRTCLYRLRRKS
jgi:hypothetical protein